MSKLKTNGMRCESAPLLSGRHLPRRGTPVFGFDVQEWLFRGSMVGDGGLQRQADAFFNGGLREAGDGPRARQAHTARLAVREQRAARLVDGRRRQALAAHLAGRTELSGSTGNTGRPALLGLGRSLRSETLGVFVRNAHTSGLLRRGD